MPDLNRIACTRCQQSVYNCEIEGPDGQKYRVPIATRINQGQPDDTGLRVAVNDPNVRMTSFTRAMMLTPLPRIELCEKCLSEVMGWPLLTADEDPMFTAGVAELNKKMEQDVFGNPKLSRVEQFAIIHGRALHAPAVAWGEATAADLPEALKPIEPAPEEDMPAAA